MKIMKILEFHTRIKKIMKIIEFQLRIMKNHENQRIQCEIPCENHENHENPKTQ